MHGETVKFVLLPFCPPPTSKIRIESEPESSVVNEGHDMTKWTRLILCKWWEVKRHTIRIAGTYRYTCPKL